MLTLFSLEFCHVLSSFVNIRRQLNERRLVLLFLGIGVRSAVVQAQQGARVFPRLQREPAVSMEVPVHAQDEGVQGAHIQVHWSYPVY